MIDIPDNSLIYVCSPYRGDVEKNTTQAQEYCRRIFDAGYTPIAPHLYFPQFLDETNPVEREAGMEKGIQLLIQCRALVVCGSEITEGMQQEIRLAAKASISILTMDQFLSEELTNHVSDITDEMRAQEAEKRTSFRSQVLAAQTGQEHDSEIHMHRGFYSVSSEGDQLQPGFRASVRHTVSLIENQDQISDLTAVPISELIDRRDSNIIAERAAFHELSVSASGWEEVAAQTLLLNKAIEYLQTRPLVHSGNEWKEDWLG